MKGIFHTDTIRYAFFFAVVFSLTACSSDSDSKSDNTTSDKITKLGFIQIDENTSDDINATFGGMYMYFIEISEGATAGEFADISSPGAVSEDQCEVKINDDETPSPVIPSALSAGDVITVSSPAGSFTELVPTTEFGPVQYFAPENVPTPFPAGLIVDVPGEEFPAFSNVAVPDVERFVLTSSPDEFSEFAIDQEITWQAGAPSNANIILYLDLNTTMPPTTDAVGLPGENIPSAETEQPVAETLEITVEIDCVLQDDGSFVFNNDIQTMLLDAGLERVPLNIGRRARALRQDGDAMLVITRSDGDLQY